MLSDADLAAIKERCERATEGPWVRQQEGVGVYAGVKKNTPGSISYRSKIADCEDDEGEVTTQGKRNAAFIAHARTDIPALLREIDRLKAEAKEKDDVWQELRRDAASPRPADAGKDSK